MEKLLFRPRDVRPAIEMPDTMRVLRAMDDEVVRDSLMDVMPGGEMARGFRGRHEFARAQEVTAVGDMNKELMG